MMLLAALEEEAGADYRTRLYNPLIIIDLFFKAQLLF